MVLPRLPRAMLATMTALAGAAALAVLGGWLATVSLQQDFAAYETAARARARGLDPYVNDLAARSNTSPEGLDPAVRAPWDGVAVYRHSRFLYPPIVADLFRPLGALPFLWAKIVFTAASVIALAAGLALLLRDTHSALPIGVPLLLAAVWPPVFVALERGQIDLLLFALLAAAWRWRDRPLAAGLALGLCALGKPFLLGLLPLLVVARRLRWAAATAAAVVLLALLSVALGGIALNRKYLTEVLPRAARYGEGGPEAWLLDEATLGQLGEAVESGTARIDGRSYVQQVGDFPRNASLTRAVAGDAPPSFGLTLAVAGAGGGLLAWAAARRRRAAGWYWGGLLFGVVAAPVSWAMSLVWALPVLVAWNGAMRPRARVLALGATFGAGLVGPWLPWAWPAAALAGVAAAILWPAAEPS